MAAVGPPGGGPPPGPGGAGVGAPPPPSNYESYYNDANNDPYQGSYDTVYALYDVATNLPPQQLRQRVYGATNRGVALAHVVLVRKTTAGIDDPGHIQAYHRVILNEADLARTTPFNDKAYAFFGDLAGTDTPVTVVWEDGYFTQAGAVIVPTAAAMDLLLNADPMATMVGPFAAGDPDTESVNVQKCMYIPNRFLPLLLNNSLTPREAWQQIRGN